jgi:hypothetical protein
MTSKATDYLVLKKWHSERAIVLQWLNNALRLNVNALRF